MIAKRATAVFGGRVYGLGVMGLGLLALKLGNFDPGQPVPKTFPDRTILAYVAAAFMTVAGTAIQWRRTAAWGAGALTAYYMLIVVIVMDGRSLIAHPAEFGSYSNTAEQLALATGALIVFAAHARIDAALAARLTRIGQIAFGVCAILFGGAHFAYMNLTAPLVPKWLPPSQLLWGYATGAAQIAAGLAILSGIQARLAAILLTVMYVGFTLLVHLPMLLASPRDPYIWSENILNIALIGVAWVVADSLANAPGLGQAAFGKPRASIVSALVFPLEALARFESGPRLALGLGGDLLQLDGLKRRKRRAPRALLRIGEGPAIGADPLFHRAQEFAFPFGQIHARLVGDQLGAP